MEDIAKAPLNQAHFLDVKAESFARRQLFEKSIQCRERAIENLESAKSLSLTDDALISIQLQISHHIQQIKNLKERLRLKESKMPAVSRVLDSNKQSPRPSSSLFPDGHPDSARSSGTLKSESAAKSELESLILNEILKGDRLLDHLVKQQLQRSDESDAELSAERQKSQMIISAIKLPKPVEQVLEELQTHNLQLKTFIGNLFEELEALKLENGKLKRKLSEYEKQSDLKDASQEMAASNKSTGSVTSPVTVDLPPLAPLEMPQMSTLVLKPRVKVPPRKSTISESST